MLNDLFKQAVILSLSASLIVLLVMGLRLVLKKAPRALVCALWALVAVRLLIPSLPQSRVSVVPQTVSEGTIVREISERPVEETVKVREYEPEYVTIITRQPQLPVKSEAAAGDPAGSAAEAPAAHKIHYVEVSAATKEAPKTFGDTVLPVLAVIWLAGVGGMLLYMAFSYFRISRKVRASLPVEEKVFVCDDLSSPFILGVIRPRIYLPSVLEEDEKNYVLAHEKAHLKRLDQVWKPLGFLLLSVYWFNPVMWAAYILLCRDIELACDEKVIGRESEGFKKAYSQALIACSAPQRLVTACPLAFGEAGVKTRVKSVLNYKKPAFWILAAALIISLIAAGCALTNPKNSSEDPAGSGTAAESTPAGTKSDESTSAGTEPIETKPQESTAEPECLVKENTGKKFLISDLQADQTAVLQADLFKKLSWGSDIGEMPQNGAGPIDFAFFEGKLTVLLDRTAKTLTAFSEELSGCVKTCPLDFCEDPRRVIYYGSGWRDRFPDIADYVCAVLDTQALYLLADPLAGGPALTYKQIPLPKGITADEVHDLRWRSNEEEPFSSAVLWGVLLMTDSGIYALDPGTLTWEKWESPYYVQSYSVSRVGDFLAVRGKFSSWTLQIPQEDVRVLGFSEYGRTLHLLVMDDDGQAASLYRLVQEEQSVNGTEILVYESRIDLSDWLYVPEHFAILDGETTWVMAPRGDGLSFYELTIGLENVGTERPVEDLSALRGRILAGEVIAVADGARISDDFPGFSIDLDGDGVPETVTVENGIGSGKERCREIYLNGKEAGFSSLLYSASYQRFSGLALYWPEEGVFRRDGEYQMYLASMDGEHILIFLSNIQQTFGLDFIEYYSPSERRTKTVARARIRAYGKPMSDFVPNRSLEEYIAGGWRCRPSDGDELDISGSGTKNIVRVSYQDEGLPVERIRIAVPENSEQERYQAVAAWTGPDGDGFIRYDHLYYEADGDGGGYDLIGALQIGDRYFQHRLKLVDASGEVLSGRDEADMVFAVKLSYGDPNWNELFHDRLPLRSPLLSDADGQTDVLIFYVWASRIEMLFTGWSLYDRRIDEGQIRDVTPDYTLKLAEGLELSALRKDHYNVNTTSRLTDGEREYCGWINGKAYWLPKAFIDLMEEWYRMPMEEQLKTLNLDFYERIYAQAGPKQRAKLDALQPEERNSQYVSGYRREILIRAGLLAEDAPRLTKEQAEAICLGFRPQDGEGPFAWMDQIMECFDEIAGAPDWIGGSGILSALYYLDDAGKARIKVDEGSVIYWDGNEEVRVLLSRWE